MSRFLTFFILLFIMIIWGLNVVAIKVLVNHFPPVIMQSTRILIAGIVVILFILWRRELRRLTKRELFYTLMATGLGVVGHHSFLAFGLAETTASNAALILALIPLTTSCLGMIFLQERLTILRMLGIGFGLVGVSFVILQGSAGIGRVSVGDLYVLGAMITQPISFILIKKVTDTLDSKQMTAIMFIIGSIALLALSLFIEPQGLSQLSTGEFGIWVILLSSAIVATGLGHMLYNSSIHRIGAGQSAIFINLVPFFALISSAIFLGETITWAQVIGFIFIVLGVTLGTGYVDEKLRRLSSDPSLAKNNSIKNKLVSK